MSSLTMIFSKVFLNVLTSVRRDSNTPSQDLQFCVPALQQVWKECRQREGSRELMVAHTLNRGRGRRKIQKRVKDMLMYLTLQGSLNQQPSSDGAQEGGGQSQLYCETHPQVPATTVLGD